MSNADDTKEIPARQVPDLQHRAPWRIVVDITSGADFVVLDGDGQVIAETHHIAGDRVDGSDGRCRARALCIRQGAGNAPLARVRNYDR